MKNKNNLCLFYIFEVIVFYNHFLLLFINIFKLIIIEPYYNIDIFLSIFKEYYVRGDIFYE